MTHQELRRVLAAIETDEFPSAYPKFTAFADTLKRQTAEGRRIVGRWSTYIKSGGVVPGVKNPPDECPPAFFLPLLQAELAAETSRRWERLTAGLRSPKRDLAADEPVPAKARALIAEADAEEAQALARFRSRLAGPASLLEYAAPLNHPSHPERLDPKQRRLRIQRRQDRKPYHHPQIRAWSSPMTQSDYVTATAMTRRTIERFLTKIKARPCSPRRHAYAPGSYNVRVNLKVLSHWIEHWVHDPARACGLAAATLVYASLNDRAFLPQLIRALCPVLKRRKVPYTELSAAIAAHKACYSPPSDPWQKLLGFKP